jgi:hypothetical protein
MIGRAIRLATWPARTAIGIVEEGYWLAQAAIEVASYGIALGKQEDEPYIWALSNEQIDAVLQ